MRTRLILVIFLFVSGNIFAAQEEKTGSLQTNGLDSLEVEKNEKPIIKKGYNFGPFPTIGFDADKGFGIGALLNIFDFGDGSTYPNPRQQWYFEATYFTKGSQVYIASYDTEHLIPKVRLSVAGRFVADNALNFTGFNGYQSFYDSERIAQGKKGEAHLYNPYYRVDRMMANAKVDFTGNITKDKRFKWVAGYHFRWDRYKDVNIGKFNKGKSEDKQYPVDGPSVFGQYKEWGIISEEEQDGGFTSSIRAGLSYDSRDVLNNPGKGLWAEANVILAPSFLGTSQSYYQYTLAFRHYVPIVYKTLTFAYRLNYYGTFGKSLPFYAMPFYHVVGKGFDRDGVGGYYTTRGMMRNRVQALDVGFYNVEFRWRFVSFKLCKQNIAFALNVFTDGAIATRYYDMSFKSTLEDFASKEEYDKSLSEYNAYMSQGKKQDGLHMTAGLGLRFIMNDNFILAAEYGIPFSKQDGNPSFYFNVGYLF